MLNEEVARRKKELEMERVAKRSANSGFFSRFWGSSEVEERNKWDRETGGVCVGSCAGTSRIQAPWNCFLKLFAYDLSILA